MELLSLDSILVARRNNYYIRYISNANKYAVTYIITISTYKTELSPSLLPVKQLNIIKISSGQTPLEIQLENNHAVFSCGIL